nr:MAG TPA: hypothetical protein [Caudoviricetes sp.]
MSECELLSVQVAAFEFSGCLIALRFWIGGFSGRSQVSVSLCRNWQKAKGGVAAKEDDADASK